MSKEFKCVRCECRFTTKPQEFWPESGPVMRPLCWDCLDYLEAAEERRAIADDEEKSPE